MVYALLADIVVVLHFLFIVYVIFGGVLVYRWPKSAWIHLPVAAYGVLIEFVGWTCPLTPLENRYRRLAGEAGYEGGFIDHYLIPIIYPGQLTSATQIVLGSLVIAVNLIVYGALLRRGREDAPE